MKRKIKKILVVLNGSKNANRGLDMAIYLARQNDTKLTGIHVICKIPKEYRELEYPEKPLLIEADRIMKYAKKRSAQNGILFEKKISFGDIGTEIVKFAKSLNYDIIIIGARGQGTFKEIFLGSVSNYVVHKSKIPVLLVR
ncbi:MAG: universal stress protein [Nitrosopumilus sp.]|nr:universal stress protein [Nitrosopumilus sp.]MDH3736575.1 universal stress protein [Nitrosopumilus sp.]MDH3832665.1 universal stress protein [Nitrosopumilus sp.]